MTRLEWLTRMVLTVGTTEKACMEWPYYVTDKGYGTLYFEGKTTRVHRVAYGIAYGAIPEGLTIDHLCKNRCCFNPAHLEAVTMGENVLRGDGPTAVNSRKTHCKNNHPLYGENIYTWNNMRHCLACRRVSQ